MATCEHCEQIEKTGGSILLTYKSKDIPNLEYYKDSVDLSLTKREPPAEDPTYKLMASSFNAYSELYTEIEINFCPMCGRELSEVD